MTLILSLLVSGSRSTTPVGAEGISALHADMETPIRHPEVLFLGLMLCPGDYGLWLGEGCMYCACRRRISRMFGELKEQTDPE